MVHPQEVDIIVAGGGPAGCVVAGRLAYADPTLKVMLIEGGSDRWPGIYVRKMQNDGINDKATFHTDTVASSHLRWRRSIVPCLENYQKPSNSDTHGYDEPIAISNGGTITALAQDFLRASDNLGVPFSDLKTSHASEIWAKYINRDTGRRSDAATAYVHSVMDVQTNIFLRTNARVSRVIFEGDKAIGVAYVPARNRGHAGRIVETIVKARKCVVVSSGTLGTPQILEQSGVGNAKRLQKMNIKVVSDLPGVGEKYQEYVAIVFRVSNESTTSDDFLRGDKEVQKELFQEWEVSPERIQKARLSSNAIDAGFKIRPTEAELKEMGPEFNQLWDTYFKDKVCRLAMFGAIVSGAYTDHTLLPPGKYITMFQYLEYPASRGRIHIRSTSPYVEPEFDSGFMNNKADFAPIRWSYKKTREVARRMDGISLPTTHASTQHPPPRQKDIDIQTAKAILPNAFTVGIHMGTWHKAGEIYDASKVHKDIKYSEEDDKAIDEWIADHVETTWHSLGTCAMKPREEGGVVDGRLNVFGTKNLKCIDLSICPDNLGTNTYSSALLVGEKGAKILRRVRLARR
ncbi:hypothetical protein C8J57DRAFT_1624531 [Mycena rebaudengoi]|nr:hypothetical protein C8J57DRAFT_1624531 [Mycena rebaudengoi]